MAYKVSKAPEGTLDKPPKIPAQKPASPPQVSGVVTHRSERRTNLPLVGSEIPRLWTPPLRPLTPETSNGFRLIEWAEQSLEIQLLPYQRWLAIHGLELNPDGTYRFRTLLVEIARQNGKSTFAMVLTLWRLLDDNVRLVVGTSTTLDVALETFLATIDLERESPSISDLFLRPRLANGQQCLTTVDGARYKIVAARGKTRGLSVDLLLLDELRTHHDFSAWSALSKTTNAKARGQRWALSNAGDNKSVVLNHLHAAALDGKDPSLGIFSWSAPDDCDLDDRDGWAMANPSLGYLISEDTIAADMATDPPAVFRTEVLCQRVQDLDALFDMAAWETGSDPSGSLTNLRSRVCAFVDVSPDLQHVTLAVAATLPDGRCRVEVVDAWDSVPDARKALTDLLKLVQPRFLGFCAGPGQGALGADLRHLPETRQLSQSEIAEACQGLVEQVASRRLLHDSDPLLTSHIAGATRLPMGDGYRFTRAGGHVDAAYAAAGAVFLARSLPLDEVQVF